MSEDWIKKSPTELKAEKEAAEAAKAEEIKAAARAKRAKVGKKWYVVKIARMWCPSQKKYVTDEPTPMEMDGWLESQIKAGLIEEVKAP